MAANTFPAIPSTRGRPPMGQAKRVPIARCRVRPDTALTLAAWQKHFACSQGLAIDHLVDFAKAHNFVPPVTSPKSANVRKPTSRHGH